jgi:hypothetical protein
LAEPFDVKQTVSLRAAASPFNDRREPGVVLRIEPDTSGGAMKFLAGTAAFSKTPKSRPSWKRRIGLRRIQVSAMPI